MIIPYKESDWDEPKTTTMVAINNMKMPKGCACCPCCYPVDAEVKTLDNGNFFCSATDEAYDLTKEIFEHNTRPDFCPLVEIVTKTRKEVTNGK